LNLVRKGSRNQNQFIGATSWFSAEFKPGKACGRLGRTPGNSGNPGTFLASHIRRLLSIWITEVNMNIITPNLLLTIALFTLSGLITATQAASETSATIPATSQPDSAACSMLMTQLECDQHKTTLAQLDPGPTRDRYLVELDAMLRDREAACSCMRKIMNETVYPSRQQALLQF
jgi:hypothetical protein